MNNNKKIKIIIVYRDNSFFHLNMLYSTIIIDEADLERIFPFLIREDIAKVEINEYDGPLMDEAQERYEQKTSEKAPNKSN